MVGVLRFTTKYEAYGESPKQSTRQHQSMSSCLSKEGYNMVGDTIIICYILIRYESRTHLKYTQVSKLSRLTNQAQT